MTTVRKIDDPLALANYPFRVTTRQAHNGKRRANGTSSRVQPRDLIRCGCCEMHLEVSREEQPLGDPHMDTLEINGVIGTVRQWQEYFLPLLGVPMPDEAREAAMRALVERRAENEPKPRRDMSEVPAGSPMTYWCRACLGVAARLPEAHRDPAPAFCIVCQPLRDKGWIDTNGRPVV